MAKGIRRIARCLSSIALFLCLAAVSTSCSDSKGGQDGGAGSGGNTGAAGTGGSGGASSRGGSGGATGGGGGGAACTGVSADCFMCATGLFCRVNEQYCQIIMARTGSTPSCAGVPAQCLPVPTCSCVAGASSCQQSGPGALTVTILAP